MADHRPGSEFPTTSDLISQLRSTFFATDFENVTKKIVSREENMKKEYNNLKKKYESLEKKHKDELKKKETEIDELKKANCELEMKIRVSEKRFLDLNVRVLSLEKLGKELMSQHDHNSPAPPPAVAAENSRQPLVSEKGDSNIKIETNFPEIIQLDDDDDDDDREGISILKRKKASNETKKKCSSDDDDSEGTVVFKRKRVSKETEGDSNGDIIDKIPSGTLKSENLEELHSQPVCSRPLSTPSSAKNKPLLKKHEPKTPVFALDGFESFDNSSSDEDTEKIDLAYLSLFDKLREERWKSEAHMLKEFEKDDDLCLNAICTIKRQNITLHGSDISRANILARWLINGDPQGRLNRKASEVNQDDLDYCRMCARKYITQFFKVYQTKKDPFFPPQTS